MFLDRLIVNIVLSCNFLVVNNLIFYKFSAAL